MGTTFYLSAGRHHHQWPKKHWRYVCMRVIYIEEEEECGGKKAVQ